MTDDDPRTGRVRCATHGDSAPAYVCGHLARGDGRAFFHAGDDPGNPRPDAWCDVCERRRVECGGRWTEEVEASLGVRLLCGGCYDGIRARLPSGTG